MGRLRRLLVYPCEVLPGNWENVRRIKKYSDNSEEITEKKVWREGVDNRTVVDIPPGSDHHEVIAALNWFATTNQVIDGAPIEGKKVKLNWTLSEKPTLEQLTEIIKDYRMLGSLYPSFEDILRSPSKVQGLGFIPLLLETQNQLIEAVLDLLPAINAKKARKFAESIPRIPDWALKVIEIWREFDNGKR